MGGFIQLGGSVATFEASLVIPRPLAATFDFVTDFRNAPKWDPRTYDAQMTTQGPIGVSTRFLLLGGLISKETKARLHVPELLVQTSKLEYEVVSFVPRQEMVVRGETSTLKYEDRLVFSAEGDATRLRYLATMELKGVLEIGDPVLKPIFDAIGAEATRGIPAAVEAAVPPDGPPRPGFPTSPIVSPHEVRRVVAQDDDPVLRNLLITQGYHDVSQQILARTGGGDMNWCTLGSWASKTAGTFIRNEEVPAFLRKLLADPGPLRAAYEELQRRLDPGAEGKPPRLVDLINAILYDCSTYIMVGNRVVYAELAQCCADFVHELGADTSPDPAKLAAFQARYTEGDPQPDELVWSPDRQLLVTPRGGQGMLRGMVGHLYRAMFETDPKRRAELILFANAQGGLHEQTRLQPYIVGSINAAITETLVKWAHRHVEHDTPAIGRSALHRLVDALMPVIGHAIEAVWQDFSTGVLMTLTLPDGVLHLGHPLPQDAGQPLLPPALATIDDPQLAAVLDKYGALEIRVADSPLQRLRDFLRARFGAAGKGVIELADVGTPNWTNFDERMRYILTLFRMRQQDPHLFQQPFTDQQRAVMFDGRIPPGQL
jgi:hypothetical protein